MLCVSCDIPAGRKVCGSPSHSAHLGCSRCYKPFPGSVGNMDYSGFNKDTWCPRTQVKHRQDVETIMGCKTKPERKRAESMLGCRYSSLLKFSYFDPVVMLAIDPMHKHSKASLAECLDCFCTDYRCPFQCSAGSY